MKRSQIFLALVVGLLAVGTITGMLMNNALHHQPTHATEAQLIFADNYISYVIEDETMAFNLFAIQPADSPHKVTTDNITSLDIENENIDIVDFSVDSGITHKGYTLINFIIAVSVRGNEIETADELALSWDEQSIVHLKIGEMTLKNKEKTHSGGFSPVGAYTVAYSSPSLDIHIQNDASETVLLEGVRDLNHNLAYSFDSSIEFLPAESKEVTVPTFHIEDAYDFYTFSPIADYTLDGVSDYTHLPGVMFRLTDPDEEKIERIIRNVS